MGVFMEVGTDGVAVITISHPPVNALSSDVIDGLFKSYKDAMRRDDVRAIVLTGVAGKFSGGADIRDFQQAQQSVQISSRQNISVELMTNTIEDGKKPSIAAIQGLALGGGLELAMSCHARVCTPDAWFGLPELTLGIIPGAGGTQRLPRLIGLQKAIEMMLLSKQISAKEGNKLGLIDIIVSHEDLLQVSRLWAVDIAMKCKPWICTLRNMDKISSLSHTHEIIKAARQEARRIAPNMPQHEACLDAIEEGIIWGGHVGLVMEAKLSKRLMLSSTSKSLVHIFFAQRATSKVLNVTDIGLKPRSIKKVGIVGGGLMGSGIATALLQYDMHVVLKETDSASLQKGLKMIEANLQSLVKKGAMAQDKVSKVLPLLKGVLDYSEFKHVDMVIEAAMEKASLKQTIFGEIEKACPPPCILATDTSIIDLNIVGMETNSQDRIVGAHFLSPAHVMPLLEIVQSERTSPQVILDLISFAKLIKKIPIVVKNSMGFAVSRIFFSYIQGAHLLAILGVDIFRIDRVIRSFGMPLGPFEVQDLIGYASLGLKEELEATFRGRTFAFPLAELMVKSGRNGKSNGRGYYIYEKGSKPKPDLSVLSVIEELRKCCSIMPSRRSISLSDQEILEMIFFMMVNEACQVMDEGIVSRASDLDIASVLGMGFPKYRGGIVFWADSVGTAHIYANLSKWAKAYGDFFLPSRYLEERTKKGIALSMISFRPSQESKARL